jgi:hypothetical protein
MAVPPPVTTTILPAAERCCWINDWRGIVMVYGNRTWEAHGEICLSYIRWKAV